MRKSRSSLVHLNVGEKSHHVETIERDEGSTQGLGAKWVDSKMISQDVKGPWFSRRDEGAGDHFVYMKGIGAQGFHRAMCSDQCNRKV